MVGVAEPLEPAGSDGLVELVVVDLLGLGEGVVRGHGHTSQRVWSEDGARSWEGASGAMESCSLRGQGRVVGGVRSSTGGHLAGPQVSAPRAQCSG